MDGGTPFVYVTGATCFRRFSPIVKEAKAYSQSFQVLTHDRRGRGDCTDTEPWSLDREVDDLEAMIDELGGRAYVYGHSSGAVIALHAAHRLRAKVKGTVLYEAPWVLNEHEHEHERDRYAVLRAQVNRLLDGGRRAAALRHFLAGIGMLRAFIAALPLFPGCRSMVALAPTLRYDLALTADLLPVDVAAKVTAGAPDRRRAQPCDAARRG